MTDVRERIPETLKGLAVPIDRLKPYAANPRNGDLELIAESLKYHSQYRPIVVRKGTNEILAGNHTYMAAMELGWKEIACTFVECDDDEAARIVLVDNRSNDRANYDDGLLAQLLEALPSLDGTGYGQDDLAALLRSSAPATGEDQAAALNEGWAVVVTCQNETEQLELLNRFQSEGLECRALMS